MTPLEVHAQALRILREMALDLDNIDAELDEREFTRWRHETLFPAAVVRWINEVGREV